jgi:hypothetical protein
VGEGETEKDGDAEAETEALAGAEPVALAVALGDADAQPLAVGVCAAPVPDAPAERDAGADAVGVSVIEALGGAVPDARPLLLLRADADPPPPPLPPLAVARADALLLEVAERDAASALPVATELAEAPPPLGEADRDGAPTVAVRGADADPVGVAVGETESIDPVGTAERLALALGELVSEGGTVPEDEPDAEPEPEAEPVGDALVDADALGVSLGTPPLGVGDSVSVAAPLADAVAVALDEIDVLGEPLALLQPDVVRVADVVPVAV